MVSRPTDYGHVAYRLRSRHASAAVTSRITYGHVQHLVQHHVQHSVEHTSATKSESSSMSSGSNARTCTPFSSLSAPQPHMGHRQPDRQIDRQARDRLSLSLSVLSVRSETQGHAHTHADNSMLRTARS
eukprot:3698985-Rhodomonas_salina.1